MLTNNQEKLIRSLVLRKNRKKSGLFVAEGLKLVKDLMSAGLQVENIFVTDGPLEGYNGSTPSQTISLQEMKRISFLETPSPVLAIVKQPSSSAEFRKNTGLVLLLDRIQDPGNMGSILRTSQAAGNKGIFLSPDCADPWSPKTLRGSQGCQFDIPIVENISDDKILNMDLNIFLSDANGQNILNFQFPKKTLIIFGAEGRGFSKAFKDNRLKSIAIPMDDTVESLNVANASSIISYLFLNQFKA